MSVEVFFILLAVAAMAGWTDAVVGGGGLLQLPALLIAGSSLPVPSVLGTNKLAATAGTLSAAITYARRHPIDRAVALRAGGVAVLGSAFGATVALVVSSAFLRPFILVVLVGVAAFILARPRFRTSAQPAAAGSSASCCWSW